MIEPSLAAFVWFPFALVFTCTFVECVTYVTKYMSSTGIIKNFGRLRDILWNVSRVSRLNFTCESTFKGSKNKKIKNNKNNNTKNKPTHFKTRAPALDLGRVMSGLSHARNLRLLCRAPISYPEPSNFLQRLLDENEGLWKGLVLKVRK